MRGRILTTLVLAATISGCGEAEEDAACVAVVEVGGHSYYGHSTPEDPVPTTGAVVEAVVPGCDDTGGSGDPDQQVETHAISGVPVGVAVLFEGEVHIREGARMPASAGSWFDSASCTGARAFDLEGRWEGVSEPAAPHFDGALDPPYDVRLDVEDGPARFIGTTLDVQVTASTSPVLAEDALVRLGTARLQASVRCDEGAFVALAVTTR